VKEARFKLMGQPSGDNRVVLFTIVDKKMFSKDLPNIFEMQAMLMPKTIYTGTYPTIKLIEESIVDRSDLNGTGVTGILTSAEWHYQEKEVKDLLGISI